MYTSAPHFISPPMQAAQKPWRYTLTQFPWANKGAESEDASDMDESWEKPPALALSPGRLSFGDVEDWGVNSTIVGVSCLIGLWRHVMEGHVKWVSQVSLDTFEQHLSTCFSKRCCDWLTSIIYHCNTLLNQCHREAWEIFRSRSWQIVALLTYTNTKSELLAF